MLSGNMVLFGNLTYWLTPIWLLSSGVSLGLLLVMAVWGVIWLVRRDLARQMVLAAKEGVLQYLFYIAILLVGLMLIGSVKMPVSRFVSSIARVMAVGPIDRTVEVPAGTQDFPIDIEFRGEELKAFNLESNQDLQVRSITGQGTNEGTVRVQAGEETVWRKTLGGDLPFPGRVTSLTATNLSSVPATFTLHLVTGVEYPQVYCIPATAFCVLILVFIYYLSRFAFPKTSAIAAATSKQAVAQPVFILTLILGSVALLSFVYIPYNTFGEDLKMLKDSGLTLIMILSIVVALWTASVSVADEIEGRTALMVLSKPIRRRQFVLGKFIGILWPLLLMFVVLGLLFLTTVSYKVVYDSRELSTPDPTWQQCYAEMIGIVPGLVLAFLETIVLTSISVAISTRLPMLANLILCSTVYVLGHLVPLLVESSVGSFPLVRFVGMLIATIFPVLDHFNIQAAVAAGVIVPSSYLAWAMLYCFLYSSIMMLLALALFEDRDLA